MWLLTYRGITIIATAIYCPALAAYRCSSIYVPIIIVYGMHVLQVLEQLEHDEPAKNAICLVAAEPILYISGRLRSCQC